MNNVRELVLDMLMEILENGGYSHLVIRDVLDKYDYSDPKEKAFVKRVTEGTLERLIQIDYVLNAFSKVPVSKMKPLIRNLMRMSVYQLLFMERIPDSAICNEAVKLAGKRGFRGLSGFVNGVLRGIARNRDNISYPDKNEDPVKAFSIRYSMPDWLVERWIACYGREKTQAILEGSLREHPVTVRLRENLSKKQTEEWFAELGKQGIAVQQHSYLSYAYRLSGAEGVKRIPGYEEGLFVVQDVSSMLVAEIATGLLKTTAAGKGNCPENPLVLDVCAAPGGKSLHMAEKLAGRGKVIARDLTEYKVSLIRDNKQRMNYDHLEVQVQDATVLDEAMIEKADVVLADLPCSGLGIMGKKRDIKYRIRPESLQELEALQKQILHVVWQYVKPGGILVYSTCTINPAENEQMADWFAQTHPFSLQSLEAFLPDALKGEGMEGKLQLFPGIHETDGFFIAGFRRKQENE